MTYQLTENISSEEAKNIGKILQDLNCLGIDVDKEDLGELILFKEDVIKLIHECKVLFNIKIDSFTKILTSFTRYNSTLIDYLGSSMQYRVVVFVKSYEDPDKMFNRSVAIYVRPVKEDFNGFELKRQPIRIETVKHALNLLKEKVCKDAKSQPEKSNSSANNSN